MPCLGFPGRDAPRQALGQLLAPPVGVKVLPAAAGVGIGLPVLAALWYGVEKCSTRERSAERLRRVLPDLIVWPLTEPAAEVYGRIAAELRRP